MHLLLQLHSCSTLLKQTVLFVSQAVLLKGGMQCCAELAKLIDAIASDRAGRVYLLQPAEHVVKALLQLLKQPQHADSATEQHMQQFTATFELTQVSA